MREEYKSAFRNVDPSELSVERVLNMTKKKKVSFKPLLIAAVIVALAMVSIISVNAATDGAVVEKVEAVVQTVKVFINGEEKNPDDIEYEHQTEIKDGKNIDHYGFKINDDSYVEFAVEGNGEDSGLNGVTIDEKGEVGGFKAKVNDGNGEIELNVPTTKQSAK